MVGHLEDSPERALCSPEISGTKQRSAGIKPQIWGVEKKDMGRGRVRGPGPGSLPGVEKKSQGSKKALHPSSPTAPLNRLNR